MSYFYGLEKHGTFDILNRILRDTESERFKADKTGTIPGITWRMGPLTVADVSQTNVLRFSEISVTVYQSTLRTHPGMLESLYTLLWYPEIWQVSVAEISVPY
jgi:hypothetical protein